MDSMIMMRMNKYVCDHVIALLFAMDSTDEPLHTFYPDIPSDICPSQAYSSADRFNRQTNWSHGHTTQQLNYNFSQSEFHPQSNPNDLYNVQVFQLLPHRYLTEVIFTRILLS
jgi:hypothetical protein